MSIERITGPVEPDSEAPEPEAADPSRRQFLRQLALAGAGAAGLTLLASESASASAPVELLLGTYSINYNFAGTTLRIESQSGGTIVGRFDDGSSFSGNVCGARPGTITICLNRVTLDGSLQMFCGAVAVRPSASGREVLLTGTFFHNGVGPYAWSATGVIR